MLWKQGDAHLQNPALFAFYLQVLFWVTFALQLGFDSRLKLRVFWRIGFYCSERSNPQFWHFRVRMGPVCNHIYIADILWTFCLEEDTLY